MNTTEEMQKAIAEEMQKAIANYAGTVTICPPGKARGKPVSPWKIRGERPKKPPLPLPKESEIRLDSERRGLKADKASRWMRAEIKRRRRLAA